MLLVAKGGIVPFEDLGTRVIARQQRFWSVNGEEPESQTLEKDTGS